MAQHTYNPNESLGAQLEKLSNAIDGLLSDYSGMIGSGIKTSQDLGLLSMADLAKEICEWGKSFPPRTFLPTRIHLLPFISGVVLTQLDMLLVDEEGELIEEMDQLKNKLSALQQRRSQLRRGV